MVRSSSRRRRWHSSGATPVSILDQARELDVGIPLAVMCYYNTVHHAGHERFAHQLLAAGISAALVPDLPLEESGPWCEAAGAAGIETVMFAAPRARPAPLIAAPRFLSVGLLGVTGNAPSWLRPRHRWPGA
jgi:tryptophan synthase alpha chain